MPAIYLEESEKFRDSFATARHPRTAVGFHPDGRWHFVVVDGRQPELSIGMSLGELARFLVDQVGVSDAYNLDGGGSTTMVLDGAIVNSPSGRSGERPVSDAILLFPAGADEH